MAKLVRILLAMALVGATSTALADEQSDKLAFLKKKMGECYQETNAARRLQCYDILSKVMRVAPESTDKGTGWQVEEDISELDDSREVFVSLSAGPGNWGPTLMLACRSGKTSVYLTSGLFLSTEGNLVAVRLDGEKAKNHYMGASSSFKAVGLWDKKKSIRFIKSMFGRESMVVSLTPYGGSRRTAKFDISGTEEAVAPLREACRW